MVCTATYALTLLHSAASISRGMLDPKWYGPLCIFENTLIFSSFILHSTIFQLWHRIPGGRFLINRWGGEIIQALGSREFEVSGHPFSSVCHAIQWIAESELAEAWEIMSSANFSTTNTERLFEIDLPMLPWDEEHWCNALPALRKHFSDRGDRWGFVQRAEFWSLGLRRELEILRTAADSVPSRQENAPDGDEVSQMFLKFTPMQQKLLTILQDKKDVSIRKVVRALWNEQHQDKVPEKLLKLISRINEGMAEQNLNLEIRRKGKTLKLCPI